MGRSAHYLVQTWVLRSHWKEVQHLAIENNNETAADFIRRAIRLEIARMRDVLGIESKLRRVKVDVRERDEREPTREPRSGKKRRAVVRVIAGGAEVAANDETPDDVDEPE